MVKAALQVSIAAAIGFGFTAVEAVHCWLSEKVVEYVDPERLVLA